MSTTFEYQPCKAGRQETALQLGGAERMKVLAPTIAYCAVGLRSRLCDVLVL